MQIRKLRILEVRHSPRLCYLLLGQVQQLTSCFPEFTMLPKKLSTLKPEWSFKKAMSPLGLVNSSLASQWPEGKDSHCQQDLPGTSLQGPTCIPLQPHHGVRWPCLIPCSSCSLCSNQTECLVPETCHTPATTGPWHVLSPLTWLLFPSPLCQVIYSSFRYQSTTASSQKPVLTFLGELNPPMKAS